MDTRMSRSFYGLPGAVDIQLVGARQSRYLCFFYFLGDLSDRVKVTFGGNGKTRLNDINAEFFQLPGHHQLFFRVHAVAGRLFPISQCRVENINAVFVFLHNVFPLVE